MNFITTTDLRTKSKELIKILREGRSVDLIHRSKIVGEIRPVHKIQPKPFNIEEFKKILKDLAPSKPTTPKQREKIYRDHLMKKYGKSIS